MATTSFEAMTAMMKAKEVKAKEETTLLNMKAMMATKAMKAKEVTTIDANNQGTETVVAMKAKEVGENQGTETVVAMKAKEVTTIDAYTETVVAKKRMMIRWKRQDDIAEALWSHNEGVSKRFRAGRY